MPANITILLFNTIWYTLTSTEKFWVHDNFWKFKHLEGFEISTVQNFKLLVTNFCHLIINIILGLSSHISGENLRQINT